MNSSNTEEQHMDIERTITEFLDIVNNDAPLTAENLESLGDLEPFSPEEWELIDNYEKQFHDEWKVLNQIN